MRHILLGSISRQREHRADLYTWICRYLCIYIYIYIYIFITISLSQATTPMDPRVLDAMLPYQTSLYGNPHSRTHSFGWDAEKAVEVAREQVAKLIGATAKVLMRTYASCMYKYPLDIIYRNRW